MPTPRATYRLQLRPGFGFEAAAGVADYLRELGISHLYASPYLQAAPGSTHGYDVVDPTRVSAELGGEAGRARLAERLTELELGQVLDIVPNHMATAPENAWWWDLLRNGPASVYEAFFDVDWDPPEPKLRNQVLMPILGDHYGRELEAGRIRLEHDAGHFTVRYFEHRLPAAPRSIGPLLVAADERAGSGGELGFLGRALATLVKPGVAEEAARAVRERDLAVLDRRVQELVEHDEALAAAVDAVVAEVNADPDALDAFLSAQNYRLAYWRTAGQELDYRRFFDIDTLAALRTEDPRVFDAVHARVLGWIRTGELDGVRVDHPDGLRDPAAYFRRLRDAAPDAWIVAEKILAPGEPRPSWPTDGTTGYRLLNDIGGLFVDPQGEATLTGLWRAITGDEREYADVAYAARMDVLRDVLGADLNRLANVFVQLCERHRRYRDFARRELRDALAEVAACFPVYRTYVTGAGAAASDRGVIAEAVRRARERAPGLDPELVEFLGAVLSGEVAGPAAQGLRMRFQQLTAPAAAKGEEDTAFYRYLRLAALSEVGGDPGRWGVSVDAFHERCARTAKEWPATMTALSTHDTKRSEDVRARLLTLTEVPERWAESVARWRRLAIGVWAEGVEPDPVMEYLLYQTAVGAWPIGEERLAAYMEKASREAKLRTSWRDPDPAYDEALRRLVARVSRGGFARELARFVEPLVAPGRVVSLAQKLIQLTAPGVPDVYQGTELWDLSLVDPDNRRPVDFAARRRLLARLDPAPDPRAILAEMESGLPKLWVVRQALRARQERPEAFAGSYTPLEVAGEAADHALGFVRGDEVAVVVPRLVIRLARNGGWRGTRVVLPAGQWRNALTGEVGEGGEQPLPDVLRHFPVALLIRESSP